MELLHFKKTTYDTHPKINEMNDEKNVMDLYNLLSHPVRHKLPQNAPNAPISA